MIMPKTDSVMVARPAVKPAASLGPWARTRSLPGHPPPVTGRWRAAVAAGGSLSATQAQTVTEPECPASEIEPNTVTIRRRVT
jgi:hypothetical protein